MTLEEEINQKILEEFEKYKKVFKNLIYFWLEALA